MVLRNTKTMADDKRSSFEKEFLDTHNTYRKKHGAPPLTLSRSLCQSAQSWADHLLSIKTMQHSDTENGENLYYAWSSSPKNLTGKEAVDNWYSEIKDYNFCNPGFGGNTGHFTQVVWKSSKEVGVGLATDGATTYVVGQYSPAGNISNQGYFEKNVLPLDTPVSQAEGGTESPAKPSRPSPSRPAAVTPRPAPPRGTTGQSDFQREALEAHNARRRLHGAPPLNLNPDLCRESQEWADHLLSLRALQHSTTSLGENIWYKWSSNKTDVSGEEAVESWYSEIKDYNFSKPGFQSSTGHFTQVVWCDSQELGIAKATDGKGMVIAVARYRPAGNITNAGYFQKNVLPRGTAPPGGSREAAVQKPQPHSSPARERGQQAVDSIESDSFSREFLQACNERRRVHGAPPLVLSPDLIGESQRWAETLLSQSVLKHSPCGHGENIWAKTGGPGTTATGREVVDAWYKESEKYDFSRSGRQDKTGHFTQLVWRSSQEVGVGVASKGGTVIVVAQFEPAGNITNPGFYARNVLPPGSKVTEQPVVESRSAGGNKVAPLPDSTLAQFSRSLLETLNGFRKKHGARPLTLSPALSKEARDWAAELVRLKALKSSGNEHGENLWYRWGSSTAPPSGSEVAESWYEESKKYNFSAPGFQSGTGNFTQMVWRSSKEVGLGLATDGNGMFISVAFYNPPGNITNKGYFQDNVLSKGARG
ncbi:GLI pathogenesis-related 2 isoform X2 [Amia ocellicauda]|uniref:GLI pathogenesis-related 2 isoform X2 n=1 Tax=Amia ocellicauda TaxID=2972642 RepID=UPI00346392DF